MLVMANHYAVFDDQEGNFKSQLKACRSLGLVLENSLTFKIKKVEFI